MEAQAWKKGGCLKAPPDTVEGRWENRKAFVREPWRAPPEVFIDNRETAVQRHKEITTLASRPLVIYTDGSGYEGRIGAAMIVDLDDQHRLSQMGTDDMSTVYAAELRAIEMALDYVRNTQEINNGVVIFADSQAALKALRRPRMPSGQIYLSGCLDALRWLTDRGIAVEFRWIPAHQGVPGNETVDRHAKDAAQADFCSQNIDNRYIRLAAATKRRFRQEMLIAWEAAWASERVGAATRRLIEAPTTKVLQYWSGLRKATSSIMLQLRTGKISLASYLQKINRRESARCACDLGNQTIGHVLLQCPLLSDQREMLRHELAEVGVSMAVGHDELLRQKVAAPAVAKFMIDSELLEQFQAVDPVATGVEDGEGENDEET
jgi:ribonuclease HI